MTGDRESIDFLSPFFMYGPVLLAFYRWDDIRFNDKRSKLQCPKESNEYSGPPDDILAPKKAKEERQCFAIESNTTGFQYSRFDTPTDKYGKPQPSEGPGTASNGVTGWMKGPEGKLGSHPPEEAHAGKLVSVGKYSQFLRLE